MVIRVAIAANDKIRNRRGHLKASPKSCKVKRRVLNNTAVSFTTYHAKMAALVHLRRAEAALGLLLVLVLFSPCVTLVESFGPTPSPLTIGTVTFGPGVCGVTYDCANEGVCTSSGASNTCQTRQPSTNIRCASGQCKCFDLCQAGPLCNSRLPWIIAMHPYYGDEFQFDCRNYDVFLASEMKFAGTFTARPALPCEYSFPSGCPNRGVCVQQNSARDVTLPGGTTKRVEPSEVCCARGYAGDWCTEWRGCSVGSCDNGGACNAGSTDCSCPRGYIGKFCESRTPDCVYTDWTAWGSCSVSCGPGKQTRT